MNFSFYPAFLLACVLSLSFGLPSKAATPRFGKTKIGGISVSGLSPATAKMRLLRGLSKKLDYRYKISDGKRTVYSKRRQLGVYLAVDSMLARAKRGDKYVPVLFDVKASHLQRALTQLKPRFAIAARPARVGEHRGKVVIIPEQNQRTLNVAASTKSVLKQLMKNPGTRVLKVQSSQKSPVLTKARLKGINARLGSYSTRFNAGNIKRTTNLKLGIKAINGKLLGPGEVFSLNDTVGERTQARGYRTSIVFQNGYKVPGIGAGISQVTGTLFNAALLSGLPIVTYRTHSRPVAYIPVGRDATVAWGGFDMKFKNNTGAPIYIAYKTLGNRAIATLYGTQKARPDKVTLKVTKQKINAREIKAQLYRVMRHNGKLIKQKIGNSHYKWKVGAWEE